VKLDIILRTHDGGDRFKSSALKRKVNGTKQEITLTCAYSLSESIKLCEHEINVTILDDHSSKKTVKTLEKMFGVRVTPFEDEDFSKGSLNHFTYSKNSNADLIYSVEDDFLHRPEAIQELIDTYYKFLDNVEAEMICLYPDDDYYNYTNHFGPTMIVPGIGRPWRMHDHTTNTFFTNPEVLRKYWGAFETLATQYYTNPIICEDTTINVIWKNHIPLFTPLVPLAHHLDHHPPLFYENAIAELWEKNKL